MDIVAFLGQRRVVAISERMGGQLVVAGMKFGLAYVPLRGNDVSTPDAQQSDFSFIQGGSAEGRSVRTSNDKYPPFT